MSDIVKTGVRKQCEERVTPIQLFHDLVFMFAIAQVTSIQGEGVLARIRASPDRGPSAIRRNAAISKT